MSLGPVLRTLNLLLPQTRLLQQYQVRLADFGGDVVAPCAESILVDRIDGPPIFLLRILAVCCSRLLGQELGAALPELITLLPPRPASKPSGFLRLSGIAFSSAAICPAFLPGFCRELGGTARILEPCWGRLWFGGEPDTC